MAWSDDAIKHCKSGGWIAGAIKKPGALHRELGVPQGQKIPAKKLAKAASRWDFFIWDYPL